MNENDIQIMNIILFFGAFNFPFRIRDSVVHQVCLHLRQPDHWILKPLKVLAIHSKAYHSLKVHPVSRVKA
jgi:hypothetical protein